MTDIFRFRHLPQSSPPPPGSDPSAADKRQRPDERVAVSRPEQDTHCDGETHAHGKHECASPGSRSRRERTQEAADSFSQRGLRPRQPRNRAGGTGMKSSDCDDGGGEILRTRLSNRWSHRVIRRDRGVRNRVRPPSPASKPRFQRPRRRIAASRPRPLPPTQPNQVWAYDFVFDPCANGQQLKCLTLVDESTREALAIDVGSSIRSGRVIEVLSRLVSLRGAPRYLRFDNGPEFVSTAVLKWVSQEGIETAHIAPGKPLAERDRRERQRQVPRRVSQHGVVPFTLGGRDDHRDLAPVLRCCPPALEPEQLRVCPG